MGEGVEWGKGQKLIFEYILFYSFEFGIMYVLHNCKIREQIKTQFPKI